MDQNIQQAIQDLAQIRRAIEKADQPESSQPALSANVLIQVLGLGTALLLGAYEVFSEHLMSWSLQLSRRDRELGMEGMIEVALCLPFFVATIYFVAWRGAQQADRTLPEFLARNFQYLRNLGFVSDLFVKFIVLALVVLSGHGEWVPALLLLFIGDYLLQGRYFTLPLKLALLAGPLCFAAAGVLYVQSSTMLVWPLAAFATLSAASLATTLSRKGRK